MKRYNFSLTMAQIEYLQEQAKKTGLSQADLLRRILDKHIEGEEKNEK